MQKGTRILATTLTLSIMLSATSIGVAAENEDTSAVFEEICTKEDTDVTSQPMENQFIVVDDSVNCKKSAKPLRRYYEQDRDLAVTDFQPLDKPMSVELQEYLYELCADRTLSQDEMFQLTMAVVERESGFHTGDVSATGDYGLMQLNRGPGGKYHAYLSEKYNVSDFLDPYQNLRAGVGLLDEYLEKYNGDIRVALLCYGRGETGARNRGFASDAKVEKAIRIMGRNKEVTANEDTVPV